MMPPAMTDAIWPETLAPTACIKRKFCGPFGCRAECAVQLDHFDSRHLFLLSHFLDNACGHRKRRNARRADHGVDFILDKQVHDFRKQYTAYGVKHECNEAQSQNKQRVHAQKFRRCHMCGDRDAENQSDQVGQHILRGIRKAV